MRRKNYKGRCEKRVLSKCQDVCRTYDEIQYAYADILERSSSIKKFNCNVPLEDMEGDIYTSDFVCLKMDGDIMVRECVRQSLNVLISSITSMAKDLLNTRKFQISIKTIRQN